MTNKDIKLENAHILFGDALARLKELPDNSVDSIVTDPPYGLSDNKYVADTIVKWVNGERSFTPDGKGFMGKAWDSFVPPPAIWDECLRVLKPGGHLLAFFGSRTQDIGALSIRLAGFEIRDSIAWVYGSGFPKSLDVSKAIDKQAGAEREVIGRNPNSRENATKDNTLYESGTVGKTDYITEAATPQAKQYAGWGTALKPAVEPIVVARKPLSESTVANNVLKWGTGGLNIDASRVGSEGGTTGIHNGTNKDLRGFNVGHKIEELNAGRFPANIILDEEAAGLLDEQSGVSASKQAFRGEQYSGSHGGLAGEIKETKEGTNTVRGHNDTGGASRFFYVAKASKKDRNEGLEGLEAVKGGSMKGVETREGKPTNHPIRQNFHPTVKPTSLMEYLIKLVTPVDGTVLDPFTGSGSTGKAALLNGFKFIGCELTEEYLPIIEGRLKFAETKHAEKTAVNDEKLF
jgi:DNA modification methylase